MQGVYDRCQRYVLDQFIEAIKVEKPDAVVIAGDLYDRAVPPTEAVALFDEVLHKIVIELKTPVLAIAGNHDSPGRLHFGSRLMKRKGYHIAGQITEHIEPVVLNDEHGEVHFHLVPFADPSVVKFLHDDETITNHNDAMKKVTDTIREKMDESARHRFVGHAFQRSMVKVKTIRVILSARLQQVGAEYVAAGLFEPFHYTALWTSSIKRIMCLAKQFWYAGSPLKYSISEEHHKRLFNR